MVHSLYHAAFFYPLLIRFPKKFIEESSES